MANTCAGQSSQYTKTTAYCTSNGSTPARAAIKKTGTTYIMHFLNSQSFHKPYSFS